MSMRYRPEIDGLRTIAVLPVVLFHAGWSIFSGGYVGVDVFFVISGYLITGIIHGEIAAGRFSLAGFYERRIRRIFPALIAMLAAVTVAACLFDLPSELRDLPRNLAGALLFASNIVIWRHSGYFDAPAESNPLLHTWSLGVEEQFYIGVPILLLLVTRYLPRHLRGVLIGATLASLALCIVATPIKANSSFFLVPTRAWELFCGALLALGCVRLPQARAARQGLAAAGLAMIAASVMLFTDKTAFPGYAAMLPVGGAVLVIGTSQGTRVGALLATRPMVAIGRISYSLYLWHWPLIVYGRRLGLIGEGAVSIAGIFVVSLVVAALSWKFIEQPFRTPALPARRLFGLAAAGTAAMLTVTIALAASDGWPQRFPPARVAYDAASRDVSPRRDACHVDTGLPPVASSCVFGDGPASVALWSDSHGVELSYALGTLDRPLRSITYSSCPPALGYTTASRPDCARHNRDVFAYLTRTASIETVVLTAYYRDIAGGHFDAEFVHTIELLKAAGKSVIVIGPFPSIDVDVPKALARGHAPDFPRSAYEQQYAKAIALLHRIERTGVTVVWPDRYACDRTRCRLEADGHPLFFDRHHPSMSGARYFVERMLAAGENPVVVAQSPQH